MDELVQVLIAAAIALIPAVAALATFYLKGYLEKLGEKADQELGEANVDAILKFAEIFVRAAEQMFGLAEEAQKKAFVVDQLEKIVDQFGLPISDEQLEALVEATFNRIKDELKTSRSPE